jgi:hypothetical protein
MLQRIVLQSKSLITIIVVVIIIIIIIMSYIVNEILMINSMVLAVNLFSFQLSFWVLIFSSVL